MLIFVAGALSAPTKTDLADNVHAAAIAGRRLLERGHTPIVPHTMFVYEDMGLGTEKQIMAACLELVRRCDAIYFVGAGPHSRAWQEVEEARKCGKPIFESMQDVPAAEKEVSVG